MQAGESEGRKVIRNEVKRKHLPLGYRLKEVVDNK